MASQGVEAPGDREEVRDHLHEPEPLDPINKVEELKSLRRVMTAYEDYRECMEDDIERWENSWSRIPLHQRGLVPEMAWKFRSLRECADQNFRCIFAMLQAFDPPFDLQEGESLLPGRPEAAAHFQHTSDGTGVAGVAGRQDLPRPQEGPWGLAGHERVGDKRERANADNSEVEGSNGPQRIRSPEPFGVEFSSKASGKGRAEASVLEHEQCEHQQPPGSSKTVNGGSRAPAGRFAFGRRSQVSPGDADKVRCMLRNIVRDWSAEGAPERAQCYDPILAELRRCFPDRDPQHPPSCLLPGAGLGRLMCEVSCLGFVAQGNEFSYYTLICSSFILNQTERPDQFTLHPWIHTQCNQRSDADLLRPVKFPDLHPASANITEGFSMCAGDFLEVYSHRNQHGVWDSVVTCFFIDTAHNIIDYIEVIAKCLRPGGVWINLGPLLYHFADAHLYSKEDDLSVELSLDVVKRVAKSYGLEIVRESEVSCTYTANLRSMMQNHYHCAFWTAVKREEAVELPAFAPPVAPVT